MGNKELSYDKAHTELEQILNSLESEEVGIDELSAKVKRAIELINYCKQKLRSTEEEVGKILDVRE